MSNPNKPKSNREPFKKADNLQGSKKSTSPSSKSKPSSCASTKSSSSQNSVGSVGIGGSGSSNKKAKPDAYLRFRLMPQGLGNNSINVYEQRVFDCVVFVIVCTKHKTVALSSTDKCRVYSWFPFVPVRDAFTWKKLSRDGLATILGIGGDTADEMDPTMAALPQYTDKWMDIIRVQLPSSRKFYTRLTQLVQLLPMDKAEVACCQDNERVQWHKLSDITKRVVDNAWGDEVVSTSRALAQGGQSFLKEFSLDKIANFYDENTDQVRLLKQAKWSLERVHALYQDYVTHLYPAFIMTPNSFRCFVLKKCLLPKNDKRIARLFKAFSEGREFITYFQLLVGLTAMDPKASNYSEARAKFVFQYYNTECKAALSSRQMAEMVTDLESAKEIRIANLFKSFSATSHCLNLDQLIDIMQKKETFPDCDRWLRLDKAYSQETDKSKGKNMAKGDLQQLNSGKAKSASKSKTKEMDLCSYHVSPKYDYGLHSVMLDSNGRCADARFIGESWTVAWPVDKMTRQRYSIETLFRSNSVASIFIDLVRGFMERMVAKGSTHDGMVSSPEDKQSLPQYVQLLCDQMMAILQLEPKLLRLTGPLYIIGDLQGSLLDLFLFDTNIFRAAPVNGHTLLFLGNYSGTSFNFGIECILYLFALKIAMPNKVYLLRGPNEVRLFNRGCLKIELLNKFGNKHGTDIYEQVNRVFDSLPLGAIIEETVLCTHSGIPNTDKKLASLFESDFSSDKYFSVSDLEESMPIGHEMVTNVPARYAPDELNIDKSGFIEAPSGDRFHFYNRNVFDAFMKLNDLSYHIRSHNPTEESFALCFQNRCITIFSCHRMQHKQANRLLKSVSVISFTDKRKIRFIRFDMSKENKSSK